MSSLTIEVWSDVACPWCWVGKRNLERAIERFDHDVSVVWRAFELNPAAPSTLEGDVDYVERLARKYGTGRAGARRMIDQMTARGAESGLEFRFDRARPVNTFDAHRLLHLAGLRGRQNALKERLFLAYMNEGKLVSDHETLVELAAEVGMDPDDARSVLSTDAYARDVRTEEAVAHELGISGVPFFVFAGRAAVGGAQPPEVLLEVMEKTWSDATGAHAARGRPPGAACGPDGCVLPAPVPVRP